MKKIIALMLTALLLLSTVSISVVAAQPSVPTEVYAGVASITVKYNEVISLDNVGEATVMDTAGNEIATTVSVKGNLLVIKPAQKFELDKEYVVVIGSIAKAFTIKKVWEPTFTDSNSDGKYEFPTGSNIPFKFRSSGEVYVGITENKDIILTQGATSGNALYLYPNTTKATTAKNMSMTFDVKFLANSDQRASYLVGYNIETATSYLNSESSYKGDALVWNTNADIRVPYRAYKIKTADNTNYTKGFNTNSIVANKNVLTPDNQVEIKSDKIKGTVTVDTTNKVKLNATEYLCDMTLSADTAEIPSYTMTVDKMGADANFSINGTLVDTVIAQTYYDECNVTGEVPPETGEVVVGFFGKTNGMVISNMMLTHTEMKDFEGNIKIASVTFKNANDEDLQSIENQETVKGVVTLKSLYSSTQPVKVIAIAYKGNSLIKLDILEIESIDAGKIIEVPYTLSGLSEVTEIKIVAWNSLSDMKPYCGYFSK